MQTRLAFPLEMEHFTMANIRQRSLWHLVLIAGLATGLAPTCSIAQDIGQSLPSTLTTENPALVYRLDLMTSELAPTDRSDLKIGYVYYHFSPQLNRWVWSYYQKNGSFWYAFGEGTTQEAWCFDIRASREALTKRLEQYPELAHQVERQDRKVCFRLQADGRWKVIQSGIPRSIFNAETGERWQVQEGEKFVPIVHTGGNSWTVRDGEYEPGSATWIP